MRLLLIMPTFFNYPEEITKELHKQGYQVDFFDDRPSRNSVVKAALKIDKKLVERQIKRYEKKILCSVSKHQYDVVLLISGQSLSLSFKCIASIKEMQPNAKFVLYMWDSLKNFGYIRQFFELFDNIYSFDEFDCENNLRVNFLPLFFTDKYRKIALDKNIKEKYDVLFVGTAHPNKYTLIKRMSDKLKPIFDKQMIYFYMPSRLLYFFRRLLDPEFKKTKISDIHFVPVSSEGLITLMRDSKIIIDAPQKHQEGLTIRCIEALGAKKKLITTNKSIIKYDFYEPENVFVFSGDFPIEDVFFTKPYKPVMQSVYEKYSLSVWLKTIICG